MNQLRVVHFLELAGACFDADKAGSRRACEAALRVAPHVSSVHFALGVLDRAEGRAAEARERFTVAKVLAETGSAEAADACFALGLVAEECGDKEEAARQFKAALACDHPHGVAMLRLALLDVRDARFHAAVPHLRRFLEGNDSAVLRKDAQQHLAACLQRVGRGKEAAAIWREAGSASEKEALVAVASKNWLTARDAYSKCLAESTEDNVRLWADYAAVLVRLGEFSDALAVYRTCCAREPAEKAHAVNAALMRQLLKRDDGAAADYEALLDQGSDTRKRLPKASRQSTRSKRARRVAEEEGEAAAEKEGEDAPASNAVLSSAWCNLGCAAVQAGQLVQASVLFERSIAQDPRCSEAHYNMGTLLLQAGRAELAVEWFQKCRAQSFAPFEVLNNLGVALVETGAFVEACAVLAEAVQMRPDHDDAAISLARAMIGSGSAEAGLRMAQDVCARGHALRALQTVAAAHFALGQAVEAEQAARACLELDAETSSAPSWALLGDALMMRNEVEAAEEAFRACVARDAGHAAAHASLGRLMLSQGRLEDAVTHLREGLAHNANMAEAQFDLGTVLAQKGAVKEAVSAFRACVDLNSRHHRAYRSWARLLASNGQEQGAVRCLELALRIVPEDIDCLSELAALHTGRGERAAARALLQRVLLLAPNNASAKSELIKVL